MTTEATKSPALELLEVADLYMEAGGMREASDALWRAVDAAFQAVADARGWQVDRHRRHYDTYNNLRPEVDIDILRDGICAGSLMRQNLVQELSLDEQWLKHCRNDIRNLVHALQVVT